VLDVRLAKAFQASRGNALGKPQKARLHVGRKSGDLRDNSFVEDIDSLRFRSYLNYEIMAKR
jgi:hypothetical protein